MQAVFNKNLVKNLPDAFKKTADSNNFKILEIERIACDDLRKALQEIDATNDIDNAKGKTLDLYGEMVGQARGVADDEKYLLMIKAKIMRNLSNGSYESIANALCITFDCKPSEIIMVDGEEPCTVDILALPLGAVNAAGFTTEQTVAIIKRMMPVGVSLTSFLFDGTFELSASYEDMKVDGETEGLTDTYENMKNPNAIGGYLGVTTGDENNILLPI